MSEPEELIQYEMSCGHLFIHIAFPYILSECQRGLTVLLAFKHSAGECLVYICLYCMPLPVSEMQFQNACLD